MDSLKLCANSSSNDNSSSISSSSSSNYYYHYRMYCTSLHLLATKLIF